MNIFLMLAQVVAAGTSFTCTPVQLWDGDGPIWCAEGPKIRLAGIAAREIDETCKPGHPCPAAGGRAARDHLAKLLGGSIRTTKTGHVLVRGRTLSCVSFGSARGDRTAAFCRGERVGDLSCAMVHAGFAARWPRYAEGRSCK